MLINRSSYQLSLTMTFICYLKYFKHKFNIIIDWDNQCQEKSFGDIQPKLVIILRTALRLEISDDRHFLEVCLQCAIHVWPFTPQLTDGSTGHQSIITNSDSKRKISAHSVFTLRAKPSPLCRGSLAIDDSDLTLFTSYSQEIIAFYLMSERLTAEDFNLKSIKMKGFQQLCKHYPKTFDAYNPRECREVFDMIIRFYANNFNKLNLKMEANQQKKFDLIKIVHTLNVNFICEKTIVEQIKVIEKDPEVNNYLHYYRTYGYDIYLGAFRRQKDIEQIILNKVFPHLILL